MFIEKPLSADSVENALQVADALVKSKAIVSVGYFLRYLRGEPSFSEPFLLLTTDSLTVPRPPVVVQKMREIIEDNELEVMATNARYYCSYANIAKPAWWMKSKDCGPSASPLARLCVFVAIRSPSSSSPFAVVEQATHFLDLSVFAVTRREAFQRADFSTARRSRYFGGDVDMSTVQAQALEWDEPAGQLSVVPVDESKIADEDRIPRVTSATWKYENGAVGSLTHALTLQGYKYSCEIEVLCVLLAVLQGDGTSTDETRGHSAPTATSSASSTRTTTPSSVFARPTATTSTSTAYVLSFASRPQEACWPGRREGPGWTRPRRVVSSFLISSPPRLSTPSRTPLTCSLMTSSATTTPTPANSTRSSTRFPPPLGRPRRLLATAPSLTRRATRGEYCRATRMPARPTPCASLPT